MRIVKGTLYKNAVSRDVRLPPKNGLSSEDLVTVSDSLANRSVFDTHRLKNGVKGRVIGSKVIDSPDGEGKDLVAVLALNDDGDELVEGGSDYLSLQHVTMRSRGPNEPEDKPMVIDSSPDDGVRGPSFALEVSLCKNPGRLGTAHTDMDIEDLDKDMRDFYISQTAACNSVTGKDGTVSPLVAFVTVSACSSAIENVTDTDINSDIVKSVVEAAGGIKAVNAIFAPTSGKFCIYR